MNNSLDENFILALKLCEKNLSYKEIIEMLKNGDLIQKQVGAIELEKIESQEDASFFVSNLIGQDGKVREAISYKLNELMANRDFLPFFCNEKNYDIFLNAIIDINGNICRNTISAISNLKNNNEFCRYFCPKLAKMTIDLIDIVNKFDFQIGKYKTNKDVFKLYWCLETINVFWNRIDGKSLKSIITGAKNISEYTIREKVAKILNNSISDFYIVDFKNELQNDLNYYVRRTIKK